MPTPTVKVQGPDGNSYEFPEGTDKAAAIKYFKAKGIGVPKTTETKGAKAQAPEQLPHFWKDSVFSLHNIEGEAFKKEVGAAGEAVKGVVTAPYHALADPMTPEQQKTYGPDSIPRRIATAPARMIADPIADAAVWYIKAAEGKIPDPVGQILSVAPEGIGTGGGAVLGGKLTETVPKVMRGLKSSTRIVMQEISGTGKEPVLSAGRKRVEVAQRQEARYQERLTAADQKYRQDVAAHAKSVQEELAKHQDKLAKAKADYDKAVQEHEQAAAADKAEYKAKVDKARKAWVDKSMEAERSSQELEKVNARRETLTKGEKAATKLLRQNIRDTHQTVRSQLDERWGQFREKMAGATVPGAKVADIIEDARTKLRGSPADIKQFNDLMRESGVTVDDDGTISVTKGEPDVPIETARVHSSAIGDRLAAGDLPGNVYQSLKAAKEGVEGLVQDAADARGLGEEYSDLKGDWSQYMSDWNDMRSVSGGKGSVLARALRAPSPEYVRPLATGRGSSLLQEAMARYRNAGAKPEHVSAIRNMVKEAQNLPKVKVSEAPKKFETPAEPKTKPGPEMKEVPAPRTPEPPVPKGVQPPRMPENVSPKDIRLRKLEEFAGRPFRWYDLFPPYLAEHMALKSPGFRDWVASQPRNELPVPPASAPAPSPAVPPGMRPGEWVKVPRVP